MPPKQSVHQRSQLAAIAAGEAKRRREPDHRKTQSSGRWLTSIQGSAMGLSSPQLAPWMDRVVGHHSKNIAGCGPLLKTNIHANTGSEKFTVLKHAVLFRA